MDDINASPEPGVSAQERTCRYGHGPLRLVNNETGARGFVALIFHDYGEELTGRSFVAPLELHVCGQCGYTELVDITPSQFAEPSEGTDG